MKTAGLFALLLVPTVAAAHERPEGDHEAHITHPITHAGGRDWEGGRGTEHEWSTGEEGPDGLPVGVTIWKTDGENEVGINAGPFENGRRDLWSGEAGRISLDTLRADDEWQAGVFVPAGGGIAAGTHAQGYATLLGLSGETKAFALGDLDGLTNAAVSDEGRVLVGAYGEEIAYAGVTRHGIEAKAGVEALAGAIARDELHGQLSVCGIAATGVGEGEASAGIGGHADAHFKIDWSTFTISAGAHAGITPGLGLGAGADVEISLDKLVRNPGAAKDCVIDGVKAIARTALATGKSLVDTAKDLGGKALDGLASAKDAIGGFVGGLFGGGSHPSSPGSNGGRNEPTRAPPSVGRGNGSGSGSPTLGRTR